MNQNAELAALIAKASTKEEAKAADLAVYHARKARDEQHKLTVNLLLAQIATIKELHGADDDRLGKLANQAEAKMDSFEPKEEAA